MLAQRIYKIERILWAFHTTVLPRERVNIQQGHLQSDVYLLKNNVS